MSRVRGKKRMEIIKKFIEGEEDPDYEVIPTVTEGKYFVRPRKGSKSKNKSQKSKQETKDEQSLDDVDEEEAIEEQGIKNVTFINNGIKPLQVEKKVNTSDKITIISVGRLSIQKNPKLFNDIALEFINNSNVQFIWCGDGELKSELTSPNIKCTGWIERKELENYLANADIYLNRMTLTVDGSIYPNLTEVMISPMNVTSLSP